MTKEQVNLEGYKSIRGKLLQRDTSPNVYRVTMEQVLGTSTKNTLLSTAEHIGPFNTRGQTSFVIPQLCLSEISPDPVEILLLPAAMVPLDNSAYPRGFMLPSFDGRDRINLFSGKSRHCSPSLLPALAASETSAFRRLNQLAPWLCGIFSEPAGYRSYAHQLAACMEVLVKQWAQPVRHPRVQVRVSETIEQAILIALLKLKDPLLCSILFDRNERNTLYRELRRNSAESISDPSGFLVAYNHQGRCETLSERLEDWWESPHSRFPIERGALVEGLEKGILWPKPLLSMMILSYLPNIPVCGGNRQKAYYASLLRSLNTITGMNRCDTLNVHGYWHAEIDYSAFSVWPEGGQPPPYGTGLALALRPFSLEEAFRQYSLHSRFPNGGER